MAQAMGYVSSTDGKTSSKFCQNVLKYKIRTASTIAIDKRLTEELRTKKSCLKEEIQ
jgi:hypothetical protein